MSGDDHEVTECGGSGPERAAEDETAVGIEPLPTHWDDAADALAETFLCTRSIRPPETTDLAGFSHACLRYAYMERRVQGDILCELPAHLPVLQTAELTGLVDLAEELAEAERACLEVPDGPIEDLADLLDDRGVKVFEWQVEAGRDLAGAFLMAEETGPALLSLAPPGSPEGRFILAHAYGHLVADVDPYENRFCPVGTGELARGGRIAGMGPADDDADELGERESRADLFARSLLVPRAHFARTLREFGQGGAQGFSPARLCDVSYYYGVPPEVVLCRLIDMEILTVAAVRELATRMPAADRAQDLAQNLTHGLAHDLAPESPAGPLGPVLTAALPRRFLNLSLALFLKGRVSKSQMSALLGSGEEMVDAVLAWVAPPAARGKKPRPRRAPEAGPAPADG